MRLCRSFLLLHYLRKPFYLHQEQGLPQLQFWVCSLEIQTQNLANNQIYTIVSFQKRTLTPQLNNFIWFLVSLDVQGRVINQSCPVNLLWNNQYNQKPSLCLRHHSETLVHNMHFLNIFVSCLRTQEGSCDLQVIMHRLQTYLCL